MQQWLAVVGSPHRRDLLPFGDLVAFAHQEVSVVPIGTEIVIVMFHDDKPAVAYQSTTAVNDLSALCGLDIRTLATGDLDALA